MSNVQLNIQKESAGKHGFVNVTGTTKAGLFSYLVPDAGAATFSAVSQDGDNLLSGERQSGEVVSGQFTSVTVSEGTVRAYRAIQ